MPKAGVENGTAVRPRDESFDLAKGIGILAVVGLHLSNRSARLFHMPYSKSWWVLKWINLFLNFCVPLFLFISAVLLARSVARQERPNWGRFAWRRSKAVVFPLLLWSGIYWGVKAAATREGRLHDPAYWSDVGARAFDLLFGKAEFHLYFLSVLAQLCILFPILVVALRSKRLSFWVALLIAIIVQTVVVLVQKQVQFKFPASTAFWYMSTVIPGVWLGLNWDKWQVVRRWAWPLGLAIAAVGFYELGIQSHQALLKEPSNGTLVNVSTWTYALGMSLLTLVGVTLWSERASRPSLLRTGLRVLGAMSLQIYLIHPMVMEVLSDRYRLFLRLPLSAFWLFLATLLITFAISWVLDKIPYVNTLLFGRDLPPRGKPKEAA